jgi:hypothetical protein
MTSINLVQSIQTELNNTSINQEVTAQRQEAKDRIGAWQGAQAMVNAMLHLMPVLVGGEVTIKYNDDRGNESFKSESKNDILWLIALQSTLESGFITKAGLVALFQQWAKDHANTNWSDNSCRTVVAGFVLNMQKHCVINYTATKMSVNGAPITAYECTPETITERNEFITQLRDSSSMVCKPMLSKPLNWTHARKGVGEDANMGLIKGQVDNTKVMSAKVLNAVNKLQSVKFKIAPCMIDAAYLLLDNPELVDSTLEDTRMYEELIKFHKDEMYFPVTMDTRGRMYYRGGVITPQGTDFCKAAFQFAESKPLGESGFEAIAIHTAGTLGYDKVSINKRIEFIQSNIDCGTFAQVHTFMDVQRLFPSASIFQATVAILEINRILGHIDSGRDPQDIRSNLVCHQDGTCNGLQHMAAITKNRQTAETVNCTKSSRDDTPKDIYGMIADFAADNTSGEVSALITRFGRSMAKNPVMITSYGAGKETIKKNTVAYLADKNIHQHGDAIGTAYKDAINTLTSATRKFTDAVESRMKTAIASGQEVFTWTTADGFVATTEYRDLEAKRVRAGNFNAIKPVDMELDEVKTSGAMAPNLIHSIDSTHLRMVVNECDHDLVTVHDSIGSHPSDFFTTGESIRTQFAAVHAYDAIGNLFSNMKARPVLFIGDYSAQEALESTYIFS